MTKRDIVLQTDFGTDSGYAAAMYGVIKIADRELNIYDLTHEIRPFDIRQAAGMLRRTIPFWPEGTVFVSVVDPGVGTERQACAAQLYNGSCVITPDNGTLTELYDLIREIRLIDESKNRFPIETGGHTFDGRDLFAWCAARLASGIIDFSEDGVGPAYDKSEIVLYTKNAPELAEGRVTCEIEDLESRYGGVGLSVSAGQLSEAEIHAGDLLRVSVEKNGETRYEAEVRYGVSFDSAEPGDPVLYDGSAGGTIFVSLNRDNFAKKHLPDLYRTGEDFSQYRVSIRKL